MLDFEPLTAADFTGNRETSIWLPNGSIARAWTHCVRDTAVPDTTPPPAPTKLQADGNEITWTAEADLEADLEAGFVIERYGQFLAKLPEQPKNPFGRRNRTGCPEVFVVAGRTGISPHSRPDLPHPNLTLWAGLPTLPVCLAQAVCHPAGRSGGSQAPPDSGPRLLPSRPEAPDTPARSAPLAKGDLELTTNLKPMEPPTSSPRGASLRSRSNLASTIGLYLGPALFAAILVFTNLDPDKPELSRMAAVATLMAVWWITEAIPLAATALLPVILYPVLGILRGRDTAPIYVNHIIFLFIGGFMIALAMEKWRLHKRIALTIIRVVGGGPNRLVLSFMIASAFLSMWISNTATAIMMLTIGLSIVRAEESAFGPERTRNLSVSLLLGIAYGCSVGGVATLVGTPPNLSLARIFEISFPQAPPISFGQWMLLGVPLALVMLALIWVLLTRVFFRSPDDLRLSSRVIQDEYQALGRPRFAEWAILAVFVSTALLWVFRKDLVLGACTVPGWSRLVPTAGFLDDGTIAITMAFLLFLIPSRSATPGACPRILDIEVFQKVPWHIVLLFGGGFALAKGFQVSGLSEFVGARFAGLEGTPPVVTIGAICSTLTFLTELTSNTATTEMVLPILASVGVAMKTNPLLLMIPATLSASCAFMMPVATPPNAIVFGSGRIRIADMVKVGLALNLVGILVITTFFYFLGTFVFDIDPATLPEWTAPSA